jgi:hypothetical protein
MVAIAAVVGITLAAGTACGGNGGGDDTASGRAIEPEAQQRAESINLTLADSRTVGEFPHLRATTTPAGRYSVSASALTTPG